MKDSLVIIQARMGSSRFPGKMTNKFLGLPLFELILKRLNPLRDLGAKIVLATSKKEIENPLIKIANKNKIEVFRGDENDVFSRFILVADHYLDKNIFIRICGDNPFIDPLLIEELYNFHISESDVDYSWNHVPRSNYNWPDGFGAECFSRSALLKADKLNLSKEELEHVTLCFYRRDYFVSKSYKPKIFFSSDIKFDIDEPNQLIFLEDLVKKFNISWSDSSQVIIDKLNKWNI